MSPCTTGDCTGHCPKSRKISTACIDVWRGHKTGQTDKHVTWPQARNLVKNSYSSVLHLASSWYTKNLRRVSRLGLFCQYTGATYLLLNSGLQHLAVHCCPTHLTVLWPWKNVNCHSWSVKMLLLCLCGCSQGYAAETKPRLWFRKPYSARLGILVFCFWRSG